MSRDLQNLSIRISPQEGDYPSRTLLKDNVVDWNPGEQPEQITQSETASINGKVSSTKRRNLSRAGSSIMIRKGTSDSNYLEEMAEDLINCNIVVIDESSTDVGVEYTGADVFFRTPSSAYGDDTMEFEVMIGSYERKRV